MGLNDMPFSLGVCGSAAGGGAGKNACIMR